MNSISSIQKYKSKLIYTLLDALFQIKVPNRIKNIEIKKVEELENI